MDTQKLRELCDARDKIDAEIAEVVTGNTNGDERPRRKWTRRNQPQQQQAEPPQL